MHHQPAGQIRIDNDDILPSQFFVNLKRVYQRGERALLAACLEASLKNLQGYHLNPRRRALRIYEEELAWVKSNDDRWLCSFCSICDHLGFDPDWLRRRILRWLATLPPGKKVYDQAYQKSTTRPGTIGRPRRKGVWIQRSKGGRWRCFVRHADLIYTMGSYGSFDEAERRRLRILSVGITRSVEQAVAIQEQEIAA